MSEAETRERPASVRRYVFFDEARPSRAWMPTLETINERFAQKLYSALVQELQPNIAVTPPNVIKLVRHSELIERLALPSHLTLVRLKALRGTMLLAADATLVGWIVESRFGGSGRFAVPSSHREFTLFEQKSMRRMAEVILEQLALAWEPIVALEAEILRHESNPQLAGIPYIVLEPLHERLMSGIIEQPFDHDQRWSEALQLGVEQAPITLNVPLAIIDITVRELLSLRPGNVFEIERPDTVTVEANGLPLFLGRWGRNGRRLAVRIEERLLPATGERGAAETGQERG